MPRPKRKRTHTRAGAAAPEALVAKWEEKLAAEGLGLVRPLTRSTLGEHGLVVVANPVAADEDWACRVNFEINGSPMSVAATDTAATWRAFSAAIWDLPPGMFAKRRIAFLHAYGEHANLQRAAREAGVTYEAARYTLAKFLRWRKERASC